MNTQMMICMVIFVATLFSYVMNKIPMWLTAMISLTALYFTGCIDAAGALAGFSNANTLLMATMFIVAAGFRRTSLVDGMCDVRIRSLQIFCWTFWIRRSARNFCRRKMV